MAKITPERKEKFTKLKKGGAGYPVLALFDHVNNVEDNLNDFKDQIKPVLEAAKKSTTSNEDMITKIVGRVLDDAKGDDGYTPKKGVDYVDGKNGKDGKDGKDGKNGKDGKDGYEGADGSDGINGVDGEDGNDGKDGKDGKDGSPDSTEELIKKINTLKDSIDPAVIKGWKDLERLMKMAAFNPTLGPSFADLQNLSNRITALSSKSSGTATLEQASGTCNGSNVTFTVLNTPIYLLGDGIAKYPGVNYTYAGGTITWTDGSPPAINLYSLHN